jgi:glycosyltransferase involved in cell wall biosynthesis
VVRTFNVECWIGETLRALRDQRYPGSIEIIVVDSGSTDRTLALAAPLADHLIQIPSGSFSFGGALNRGAERATGDLLLNLSADATPLGREYLTTLTAPLKSQDIAATFGRDCPRPGASPSQARDNESWFPAGGQLDPATRFSNANACLRRSVWQQFRFDETFPGAEDREWASRVLAAGYRILYAPQATVAHSHPPFPRDVYRRAFRERRALCKLNPAEGNFGPWLALRFWLGLSYLDFGYAWRHRYVPKWYLHIPLYRAAQAWGLYRGAQFARQLQRGS